MINPFRAIILALLIIVISPAALAASPTVLVNGRFLSADVPALIENNRVLVPMSSIFSALGARLSWDGNTRTIQGEKDFTSISLQIGKDIATVNGLQVSLDSPPIIQDGRTMVPVSFIARSLGAEVLWDSPSQTVSIIYTSPNLTATEIMKALSSTVVSISAYDQEGEFFSYGSGVIVTREGKILTAYHVIDGASTLKIKMENDKEFPCTIVADYNVDRDIAVLQISAPDLKTAPLGDSNTLSTGDKIITIGCPYGLERTMSDGLVSSKIRVFEDINYIQISAPIDFGSSGGALLDMRGQLVGITCAGISEAQGLNFAIPINEVKAYLKSDKNIPISSITPVYD